LIDKFPQRTLAFTDIPKAQLTGHTSNIISNDSDASSGQSMALIKITSSKPAQIQKIWR